MAADSYSLRRRRWIVGAVALGLVLAAIGTWLAVAGSSRPAPAPTSSSAPEPFTQPRTSSDDAAPVTLGEIEKTADPEAFADAVAQALFTWDTATPIPLADYTGRLIAVADPSGVESPGLVADIAGYLPNEDAWARLREYYTRQWIEISSITIPTKWGQALAEAGDNLAPGTTAYTIRGIRHRSGAWEGEPVESAHEVAFTVFIVCGPTYDECHLLRLSRLDEPLE